MEADWEVEIGGDSPVIEASWSGFCDLRLSPEHAFKLPEANLLPGLAEALVQLNHRSSPIWTAKCDVWELHSSDFDPDELDAETGSTETACACYVDLLPGSDPMWVFPEFAVKICQTICSRLKPVNLRNSRIDLIVRRALLAPDNWNYGVTAYATACGPTPTAAKSRLTEALRILVHTIQSNSAVE